MKYDLRTCDSAYDFIVDFMNMTSKEYLDEWIIGCKKILIFFGKEIMIKLLKLTFPNYKLWHSILLEH